MKSNFPSIHERVTIRDDKELIIKKARLEDYENVLSIGVMYNGLDYLPSLYKPLLKSGDAHMFVGNMDGETVRMLQYCKDAITALFDDKFDRQMLHNVTLI